MLELKTYYRAYQEYLEKMSQDQPHRAIVRALQADTNASEGYTEGLNRIVWDEVWINAMMDAMPSVERALDEQRKFIESHEEIRRIDQARRTTVESVRHLAQHSNMISNVQGDDIIPDRVLIVEREDNYAIYENRFLHTLVMRMKAFLDARCKAVDELGGTQAHSFHMNRCATWNRTHIEANLSLSYAKRPERNTGTDQKEMSSTEKVRYLRMRVDDLACMPLMRLLKGVTPVSAPIVRTNVFKKNDNFKKALELFEFLEAYTRTGYEIIADEPGGKALNERFREDLCEVIALENFIGQINLDSELRRTLEENFRHENELAEQERIRMEEERERAVQARIEAARAEEIAIREAEIAKREAEIDTLKQQIAQRDSEISSLKAAALAAETEFKNKLLQTQAEHRNKISVMQAEHDSALRNMQKSIEDESARMRNEISVLNQKHDRELKALISQKDDECMIAVQKAQETAKQHYSEAEGEWTQRMYAELNTLEKKHETAVKRMKRRNDTRIEQLEEMLSDTEMRLERAERRIERMKDEHGFSLKNLLRK